MADINVGSVQATVRLDASQFESGIKAVSTGLGNLSQSFQKTENAINRGFGSLQNSIGQHTNAMNMNFVAVSRQMQATANILTTGFQNINSLLVTSSQVSSHWSRGIVNSMNAVGTATSNVDKSVKSMATDLGNSLNAINNSAKNFHNSMATATTSILSELKLIRQSFQNLNVVSKQDFTQGIRNLTNSTANARNVISRNLRGVRSDVQNVNTSLRNFGSGVAVHNGLNTALRDTNVTLGQTQGILNNFPPSLSTIIGGFQKMSFNAFLIKSGVQQLGDALNSLLMPGIEFNKMLETESYGMAGILMSMTNVNGKAWEFRDALKFGNDIIGKMNNEAIKTAATTTELVTTFRALLGPGLGAGMSIKQIQDFTVVGVNAVKSMGLEGRQLVQELRDLVQGGIRAASSTLATALGLKDADIKAAKNSAEGLFAFLMKRMEGFKTSAEEFPKTLQGAMAVVGEGFTVALAKAEEPLVNLIKEVYNSLKNIVFTEDMQLNPGFVEGLSTAVEHMINLYNNIMKVATVVGTYLAPAFQMIGGLLGWICDNADKLLYIMGALTLARSISDFLALSLSVQGTYQATTLLGRAVQFVGQAINVNGTRAIALNQQQRTELMALANTELNNLARLTTARQQATALQVRAQQEMTQGHYGIAANLTTLIARYQQLGLTYEEAASLGQRMLQVLEQNGRAVYQQTDANIQAQMRYNNTLNTLQSRIGIITGVTGAIFGLAEAYRMLKGDEDAEAQQTAINIEKCAMLIGTLATVTQTIVSLGQALQTAGRIARVAWLNILGPIGLAVGAVWAMSEAIGYLNKKSKEVLDEHDTKQKVDAWNKEKISDKEFDKQYAFDDYGEVEVTKKDFGGNAGDSKNKGAQKRLNNAYKDLERDLGKFKETLKGYSTQLKDAYSNDLLATQEYVEDSLIIKRAELKKEEEILKKKLELARANGDENSVNKFNDELEKLETKRYNAEIEAQKKLREEYKKLDDRLKNITKNYQGLVGVSEQAFKDNLAREMANDIVRLSKELDVANTRINDTKTSAEDLKIWKQRRDNLQTHIAQLREIIAVKGVKYLIDQKEAELTSLSLSTQEKFIDLQSKVNNGSYSSWLLETQVWRDKKAHAEEYIKVYKEQIALYEEMASKANDVATKVSWTKKALEAKQALADFKNSLSPVREELQKTFKDGMSDAYQAILWGEKTFPEAMKDVLTNIGKTFTKKIFDSIFDNISSKMFDALMPNTKMAVKQKVEAKVTVNMKPFEDATIKAAESVKENADTLIPSIKGIKESFDNGLYPAIQRLKELIESINPTPPNPDSPDNPNSPNAPNGGDVLPSSGNTNEKFGVFGKSLDLVSEKGISLATSLDDMSIKVDKVISSLDVHKDVVKKDGDNQKKAGVSAFDAAIASGMLATSLIASTTASEKLQKAMLILQTVMQVISIMKNSPIGFFGMATGGLVRGEGTGTSDSIPARLSNGEYVMKATTVRKYGSDFFDSLNYGSPRRSARLPRFAFAEGGLVSNDDYTETTSQAGNQGNAYGGTVVNMNMSFQSLDPESNMKLMEAQYPTIRQKLIRDLQGNSAMRSAVRGIK